MYLKFIISGLIFFAGSAKLFGVKPIADQFEEFGLSKKKMYLIGILEIILAITLQIDILTLFSLVSLIVIMSGAVFYHLKIKHPFSKSFPSFMILILAVVSIYYELIIF